MKNIVVLFLGLGLLAVRNPAAAQNKGLVPDYATVQYGGSVGWLSAGVDYDLFKKERARLGLLYGYVPEKWGGELHLVSAAFFYEPFEIKVSERATINPLDVGLKVSYQFGNNFHSRWPSHYPDGYYWWTTSFLMHLATQTSLTWKLPETSAIKAITGYAELNTNDLYLVSYIQNAKSLHLTDIVKLGFGVRMKF